jgi:hypothetical protein
MTDEDFLEFEIRRKLRWQRDGAGWILLYGPNRRRMGRVVPDRKHVGMYRIVLSPGRFGDMANRSWTKDGVMAAAIRELLWEVRHRPANDPPKCLVNRGFLAA